MRVPRAELAFGLIMTVFFCRLVLAGLVVPPWQHPDEPSHFARARQFTNTAANGPSSDERDIVESMARYDWWRLYGRRSPESLPSSVGDVTTVALGPAAYYVAAGSLLRWLPLEDLLTQLYVLRAFSACFGLLTLWCAWRGSRYLIPENEALLVPAILALHPQFALVSTAVNPDAAINLCGAVVWWHAMRLLAGFLSSLGVLLAAAVAAALTRRVGVPLVLMAGLAWFVAVVQSFKSGWSHTARTVLISAAVALCATVATAWFHPEITGLLDFTVPMLRRGLENDYDWGFILPFSTVLFDSSWLVAGWMRFPAPEAWLMVARVLVAFSVLGLVLACRKDGQIRRRPWLFSVTVVFVGIQIAAIYLWFFPLRIGPQGRYWFPVIAPAALLLWTGYRAWWSDRLWRVGAVILMVVLTLLDTIGWSNVLVPAFLA